MARRRVSPPPAPFNAAPSSRNGSSNSGHNRRPLPDAGNAARGMATAHVTCRVCGCLNFSLRDLCDACRLDSRSPTSHARRSPPPSAASSSTANPGLQFFARRSSPWSSRGEGGQNAASGTRRANGAEDSGRPRVGKRARSEGQAQQQQGGGEAREPEVIDLISDDEDENEPMPQRGGSDQEEVVIVQASLQAGHTDSGQAPATPSDRAASSTAALSAERVDGRPEVEEEEKTPALFMSRVFADVNYVVTDFPTDAEANAARKNHAMSGSGGAPAKRAESTASSVTSSAGSAVSASLPVDTESIAAIDESKSAAAAAPDATRKSSSPPADSGHGPTAQASSSSSPPSSTPASQAVHSAPSPPEAVAPPAKPAESSQSTSTILLAPPPGPEPELQRRADTEQTVGASTSTTASTLLGATSVATSKTGPDLSSVDGEGDAEDDGSPWMSRVFETVTFDNNDFATGLEGVSVARRSHPPRPVHSTVPTSEDSATATISDATSASSHAFNSSEPPSTTTTASAGVSPLVVLASAMTTGTMPMVQQATSAAAPASPPRTAAASSRESPLPSSPQVKLEPPALVPFYRQVQKPNALGECSAEFLMFVKECGGESYVEDDEEWRQQQLQMLDVVDLTNLSDSEGEGTDDSDDDFELLGDSRNGYVMAPAQSNGGNAANGFEATSTGSVPSLASAAPAAGPTVESVMGAAPPAPKPAAPVLAECMLCGERRSVRTMTQCPKCKEYYHTWCARDFGGAVRCWECEPNEFIDDSELTEAVHEETVSMLRVFRQDPSSPSDEGGGEGEEGEGEQIEEVGAEQEGGEDQDEDGNHEMEDVDDFGDDNPLMSGRPTRSEWRWSTFVNDSTASLDSHFREVTERIEREMATSEGRARYSQGFVTREAFNASMNGVVNRYVELERERARAQAQAHAQAQAQAQAQTQAQGQTQVQEQAGAPGSVGTGSAAATAAAVSFNGDVNVPPQAARGEHPPTVS